MNKSSSQSSKRSAPSAKAGKSPLSRLFAKQQKRVKAKTNVANVLTTFAAEDHKRIAILIKAWLEKDEKRRQRSMNPNGVGASRRRVK